VWLAQQYNVRVPEWKRDDNTEAAKTQKSRAQVFEIACAWFEQQLWKTPAALAYARGRGWTDETIRKAKLGFSGGTFEAANDLMGEFSMNQVNLRDAATIALIGMRGNVGAWLRAEGIDDGSPDWVEDDRIWGLANIPCLIYPHIWRGRAMYFTGRRLEWATKSGKAFGWAMLKDQMDDVKLIGKDAPKSYNLPQSLVGEKVRFFNHEFHRNAEKVIIVEGQGDAISLGQLGFAAVALCGVSADKELAETLKKVPTKFVALDDDKAGREAIIGVAQTFGPMTRLLKWEHSQKAPVAVVNEADEVDVAAAADVVTEAEDGGNDGQG
jgi:5S rRNA maturation endonuclease (ribonuclease M5)